MTTTDTTLAAVGTIEIAVRMLAAPDEAAARRADLEALLGDADAPAVALEIALVLVGATIGLTAAGGGFSLGQLCDRLRRGALAADATGE